ncbi:predicted protein [Lichtheimia corymbifera JMRC:FSU:9682]|uniref:Uncharacterized protein n=1 Tax=Lichtheimia corymbifera JMRC:FSU:9682 TaxID=1263082 RepID=A0A068S900_9FUNG|nr:predicted protein [Lichtheimia corymbifera JMRC:FSU:9682]
MMKAIFIKWFVYLITGLFGVISFSNIFNHFDPLVIGSSTMSTWPAAFDTPAWPQSVAATHICIYQNS